MADQEIDATLLVEDGLSTRALNVDDFSPSELAAIQVAAEALLDGATEQTLLEAIRDKIPDEDGTWGYAGGTDGTPSLPVGCRVIGIAAISTGAGASVTIDGGDSIPIPANIGWELAPRANLIAPTLVFTATASYTVEYLT